MKKRILYFIGLLILACALSVTVSCKKKENQTKDPIIGDVSLNRTAMELVLGEDEQLTASIDDGDEVRFAWESSDPSVAAVDDNGRITALKAGTATVTASYKTKSASCNVNVSLGGFLPSITFDYLTSDSVKVDTANEVNLAASVLFNGREYSDNTVEYDVSDSTIGFIHDGIFTPSKVGSVTVTATAVWRGVESEYLSKSITVDVIHRIESIVNGKPVPSSVKLSTVNSFEGKEYETEMNFDASLKVDGSPVRIEIAVEKVQGEDIAVYDGQSKKLTAKKHGKTTLTLSYTNGSDIDFTQTVDIAVERPIAKYSETIEWFSAYDGELSDDAGNNVLTELFGQDEIESATQYGNELDVSKPGKILGAETSATEKTMTQITVHGERFSYIFDVEGYTFVIDEPKDLLEIELNDNKKLIKGYFILKNDIDSSQAYDFNKTRRHWANKSSYLTNSAEGGFQGTFDGNGHAIDKLCINNSWGFFGCGASLTVKDLAFTNVDASGINVAILFGTWCGHGNAPLYIENVYAQVNMSTRTSQLGIIKSARNGQAKINNFLLEINTTENPCTSATDAVQGVGLFRSDKYSVDFANATSSWAYKGAEMTNMYIVSAPHRNGRVFPLVQYAGVSVYASNDYADMAEATAIKFENNVPVADASGTDKIYHYQYAYRYDSYENMKSAGVSSVGGWDISSGSPKWTSAV